MAVVTNKNAEKSHFDREPKSIGKKRNNCVHEPLLIPVALSMYAVSHKD